MLRLDVSYRNMIAVVGMQVITIKIMSFLEMRIIELFLDCMYQDDQESITWKINALLGHHSSDW